MGYSIYYDSERKRDLGYGVPAVCDHPDCNEKIDRGLAYVCGGEPRYNDEGCALYFCGKHLRFYHRIDEEAEEEIMSHQLCERCGAAYENEDLAIETFKMKPDVQEWIDWKMTDPSWKEWRDENPDFVKEHS